MAGQKLKTSDDAPAVAPASSKPAPAVSPIAGTVSESSGSLADAANAAKISSPAPVNGGDPAAATGVDMAKMENESGVTSRALDAAAYSSSTGKDVSTYPDFGKLTPGEAKYAQQKAEVNQKIIKADTTKAGKAAQGIVNTLPKLPFGAGMVADAAGGAPGMSYLASGGAYSDPRHVGYEGPNELLDWKGKQMTGAHEPMDGYYPPKIQGGGGGGDNRPSMEGMYTEGGNSKADIWQDPNPGGSSPIEQKGGSSWGASENSGGPRAELQAEVAKPKKDVDWGKIWGYAKKGLLTLADIADAYGSGKRAYAGKDSPTRLQQQFKNRLVMEQQAAQAKSAAEAEISKYEPQTQAEIRKIRAQYEAEGNKDVFVSQMNQLRNLKLIDEQTYVAMMNSIGPQKFTPGGAAALANDLTNSPGGMSK